MKYYLILFILFYATGAHAVDEVGFFEGIGQSLQSIVDFFLVDLPDLFASIYSTFIQWYVLAKIQAMIWSVEFSYKIAKALIDDLSVTKYLSSALSSIPSNIGYYLNTLGIPDCIQLIIEAWTTRFVMTLRAS